MSRDPGVADTEKETDFLELCNSFKNRGDFDALRKSILNEFQSSEAKNVLMLRLENILAGYLARKGHVRLRSEQMHLFYEDAMREVMRNNVVRNLRRDIENSIIRSKGPQIEESLRAILTQPSPAPVPRPKQAIHLPPPLVQRPVLPPKIVLPESTHSTPQQSQTGIETLPAQSETLASSSLAQGDLFATSVGPVASTSKVTLMNDEAVKANPPDLTEEQQGHTNSETVSKDQDALAHSSKRDADELATKVDERAAKSILDSTTQKQDDQRAMNSATAEEEGTAQEAASKSGRLLTIRADKEREQHLNEDETKGVLISLPGVRINHSDSQIEWDSAIQPKRRGRRTNAMKAAAAASTTKEESKSSVSSLQASSTTNELRRSARGSRALVIESTKDHQKPSTESEEASTRAKRASVKASSVKVEADDDSGSLTSLSDTEPESEDSREEEEEEAPVAKRSRRG